MENIGVLMPLNEILTVKSAAILRTVSKTCKYFVKVKEYSFYKIFKQLDLSIDNVIKMVFEADLHFLDHDKDETFYLSIENHEYGDKLKELVLDSKYYFCLTEFADHITEYNIDTNDDDFLQIACDFCVLHTPYHPLQGLLIEMCNNNIF